MTIEQKALREWGPTDDPFRAIWILRDGTLVNGCMGGCVRDVDHAEIGQFFKRSVYEDPGSNWIYIKKFMRRGNVRMSMEGTAYFELAVPPTRQQWAAMGRCFAAARREGKDIAIERMGRRPGCGRLYNRESYIGYLSRYLPGLLRAPQGGIDRCLDT